MNKFKKTAMRKQQTSSQSENVQAVEKDIMEGKYCSLSEIACSGDAHNLLLFEVPDKEVVLEAVSAYLTFQ